MLTQNSERAYMSGVIRAYNHIKKEYAALYTVDVQQGPKPTPLLKSEDTKETKIKILRGLLKMPEWQAAFRPFAKTVFPQFIKGCGSDWTGAHACYPLSNTYKTALTAIGSDFDIVSKMSLRQVSIGQNLVNSIDHAWLESDGVVVDPTVTQYLDDKTQSELRESGHLVGDTYVGPADHYEIVLNSSMPSITMYSRDYIESETVNEDSYKAALKHRSVRHNYFSNPFTKTSLGRVESIEGIKKLQKIELTHWRKLVLDYDYDYYYDYDEVRPSSAVSSKK